MSDFKCPGLTRRRFMKKTSIAAAGLATLPLMQQRPVRGASPTSTVFQVDDIEGVQSGGHFGGLDALLQLMGKHGLKLYRSSVAGAESGPGGLIGGNDVVMFKVNSQWDDRGMTNVDLIRGLVQRIVEHPEGFSGEIVLVENIQFVSATDTFGWQGLTNCEDRTQTYRDIINDYTAAGHAISGYAWKDIRFNVVTTADDYVTDDYYHDPSGASEHYPRFTTAHGTRINFQKGIWNGSAYDNERLKLINLPVLKDHQYKTMITACLKNYMGVISPNGNDSWGIEYHDNFQTLVGRMVILNLPAFSR